MKLIRALSKPLYSSSFILGNMLPNFFGLDIFQNLKNLVLIKNILSYLDCDTEKDIEVVEEVNNKLRNSNILASYAVPGELLKLGSDVYLKLSKSGSEFLNHGYLHILHILKKIVLILALCFMTS